MLLKNNFEVPVGNLSAYHALGQALARRVAAGVSKLVRAKGFSNLLARAQITNFGEPSFCVEITIESDSKACDCAAEVFDWVIPVPLKELDYPSSLWGLAAKSTPHKSVPLTVAHVLKVAVQMLFTELSHAEYVTTHQDLTGEVAIDLVTGEARATIDGAATLNPLLAAPELPGVELRVQVAQAFNPALVRVHDQIKTAVRRANYRLCPRAGIVFLRDHGTFVSHTEIGDLRDRQVKGLRRLGDKAALALPQEESSLEDVRLFEWRDSIYALGNLKRREIAAGQADYTTMCLAKVDPARWILEGPVLLSSPTGARVEKNWMPLVRGDVLFFVYSLDPITIYQYSADGALELQYSFEAAPDLKGCRGGSQFVAYADGFLAVVHAKYFARQRAIYRNKFVWISSDFTQVRTSEMFTLRKEPVEFVSSLLIDAGDALIGVGYNDSIAAVERVPLRIVEGMLGPRRPLAPRAA
jgi:hypothetical protein